MNIVVCMKAVPSTTEVRMDPRTHTIIRDGKQSVMNPFDTSALEVALELVEHSDGSVHVLSMGIPDTERLLRDALSRGADTALLLSDRAFAGADTLATSYALSLGIAQMGTTASASSRALPVDLIICGKMAVDGDTAQIGPELAGVFGIPCVTGVSAIQAVSPDMLTVAHETDEGTECVEVTLPAVLTVTKEIATLRMPSIAGVRTAEKMQVKVLDAQAAGADRSRCGLDGSPTQVVRSFVPEHTQVAHVVAGTPAEQASVLASVCHEVMS